MALLFKGGEQLYNEALDAVGRKDYSTARKKFTDANEKGYGKDGLALAYAAIIDVGSNRSNVGAYQKLADRLTTLNVGSIKFGLTDIDVQDMIAECELAIKEIQASMMSDSAYMEKGNQLIAVAGEYMGRIGEKNLKLDEIFKGNTMATGNREALILQAQGYAVLGKGHVLTDPKMASEYMQMAYNFRRQLGDSGEEEYRLSQNYARSARCWICGRPASGEGIHFQSIKADIDPVFSNMSKDEIVKPVSEDSQRIYICNPCFSGISNRSDDIARGYYNEAIRELRATELRLQAEINSLRFSVNMRR